MTIHLPKDVEISINAEVLGGHFASVDDAIAAAWRAFQGQQRQGQAGAPEPLASQANPAQARKPIWEVAAEIRNSVPQEEWDKLPTDGAEQHDHYIYGLQKRPKA